MAVTQSVANSGLDQEIYHEAGAFYKRRRQLFILQLVEMLLFAGILGSVAWWHSHDGLLTGMNVLIGIGIARSTYTNRRGKIFLGAKR